MCKITYNSMDMIRFFLNLILIFAFQFVYKKIYEIFAHFLYHAKGYREFFQI